MSSKLTTRQLRAFRKANDKAEQRVQLRERKAQRAAERAAGSPKPPRRRDWDEDEDAERFEKRTRHPPLPDVATPQVEAPEPPPESVGTVIEVRSGDSLVMYRGRTLPALLPPAGRVADAGDRSPLAVGDRVQLEAVDGAQVRITMRLPRRSALARDTYDASRRGPHKGHVLAANIDQVIIVCSPAEPPFRPGLIDRYLVGASRDGLPAVICLNKADLGVPSEVEESLQGYAALGVPSIRASALSADGVGNLKAGISGKVSLFTGHSGVGKSSLLNALEPGLALRIGDVTQASAGQGKGRHTTSSARLIPLSPPDTFVVDTPGIRSFGIRGIPRPELATYLPDIGELAPGCTFRDCMHRHERGCAVERAAAGASFLRERLRSYRRMLAELP